MKSLSQGVANRGWTVRPISISNVSQYHSLTRPISLTSLGGKPALEWFGPWVTSFYNDTLGRPPENQYVVEQVKSLQAGRTMKDVVHQFLTSPELGHVWGVWLYRHYLDREPEPGAAEGRRDQFMQYTYFPQPSPFPPLTQFSFQQVTKDFCNSDEFKTKHPVPKEFIKFLYYKILDRKQDPEVNDPSGFQYWLSKINDGTSTLDIIHSFLSSPEYAYVTVNNYFLKYMRIEHPHDPDPQDPDSGLVKRIMNMDPLQEVIKDIVCSEDYKNSAYSTYCALSRAEQFTNCQGGIVWINYPVTQSLTPQSICRPASLHAVASIIREAEAAHKHVHPFGSKWSFSDCAITNDYVIDTTCLNQELHKVKLALKPDISLDVYHVEAGIKIRNLYENLDRLGLALETMGGASGQTLAGAISTGTHGGDKFMPPLADSVLAIHLIGIGGTQFWIEPSNGITDPALLKTHVVPDIDPNNIIYDDSIFNTCLVSLGSVGVIYAVVLRVRQSYDLVETTLESTWQDFRENISAYMNDTRSRFLQVIVSPYPGRNNQNPCLITTRYEAGATEPGHRRSQEKPEEVIRSMYLSFSLDSILKLDRFGVTEENLNAMPSKEEAFARLVKEVLTLVPQERSKLVEYYWRIIRASARFPTKTFRGSSYSIMDIGYQQVEQAPLSLPSHSVEIFFPDSVQNGTLSFVDFVDRAIENIARADDTYFAGYIALRFMGPTRAFLGMQQWKQTCSVEISVLQGVPGLPQLLAGLLNIGLSGGALAHWGQQIDWADKSHGSVYPKYTKWRQGYARLSNNFSTRTFENGLSLRWNLTRPNDSKFISQIVPTMVEPGQSVSVTIIMQNSGVTAWTRSASYKLGESISHGVTGTGWGISRVELPQDLLPGAQVSFQFNIIAPNKGIGSGISKLFQWRMLQEMVEWFGVETPPLEIRIVPRQGTTVTVPDVIETSKIQANRIILDAFLVPKFTGSVGLPNTVVDSQSPLGGAVVPIGSEVTVHLKAVLSP